MGLSAMLAAALTERVQNAIESISGPWLYVVAGLLTFAETGTLFFLIPGEIGLLVAGAAAGAGDLNLIVMLLIANVAALVGDAAGFTIGRRFGPRLKRSWLGRKVGEGNWLRAEDLVRRRKGTVVLFGRWIGFLRAVMPATAGMTGMSYRSFLPWDVAGCVTWASTCVVGGFLLGENWVRLAEGIGWFGWIVAAVLVVAIAVHFVRSRRHQRHAAARAEAEAAAATGERALDETVA